MGNLIVPSKTVRCSRPCSINRIALVPDTWQELTVDFDTIFIAFNWKTKIVQDQQTIISFHFDRCESWWRIKNRITWLPWFSIIMEMKCCVQWSAPKDQRASIFSLFPPTLLRSKNSPILPVEMWSNYLLIPRKDYFLYSGHFQQVVFRMRQRQREAHWKT